MINTIFEAIEKKEDLRKNLSVLRQFAKEEAGLLIVQNAMKSKDMFIDLLAEEDPKVRKGAALLIGELQIQEGLEAMYQAYCKEEQLFVKSSYLTGMSKLDCKQYLAEFKERYEYLCSITPKEDEKKHIMAEIKELDKILIKLEGAKKHTFVGYNEPLDLILTTNRNFADVTARQIVNGKTSKNPLGVKVFTENIEELLEIRTFREILFELNCSRKLPEDAMALADALVSSNMIELLEKCHRQEAPFYFRIELRGKMSLDKKAVFTRKIAQAIEEKTNRKLINSTSDYEVEIRLLQSKDGFFYPCLKMYTIPLHRFAYRKNTIASSIHPATAALFMEIAKPYLEEGAQILDPFCGVGTMLIERNLCVQAKEMYGVDIYGEAITGARANTDILGMIINYIHRDYFEFKHDYLFDEIITDMPIRGKKTKEEQDLFYERFFQKSEEILKKDGIIIMYSNEIGFVKKQMRLNTKYRLLKEYCIREKDGYYIFIISFKG